MQKMDTSFTAALQNAIDHMSQGHGDKVVTSCRKLLKKYPDSFDVLHLMGVGYRIQGRFDQALNYYLKALRINPEGSATLFCNLAFAYLEMPGEDIFAADRCMRKARELAPKMQEVYEVSADVALRIGDPLSAERYLEKSLEIRPENPTLWLKLSKAQQTSGLLDESVKSIEHGLGISPAEPELLCQLGDVREVRDETDAALDAYQSAIDNHHPKPEEVERKILAMLSTHGVKELLIARSEQILKERPDYVPAHLQLLRTGNYPGGTQKGVEYFSKRKDLRNDLVEFAIADGFDKEERYEESFRQYVRANKSKATQSGGSVIERTIKQHTRIKDFYVKFSESLLKPSDKPEDYPTPIFVLGMPRSGTSLTEQLLGSHSQIQPAGELQFFLSLSKFGMNEFRGEKKQRQMDYWCWVRDTYLECLARVSSGKRFVVDKMPHNFEFVGFIKELFPNAIIVHSSREPISNCLSIYKTNFAGYHPYAQDLKTLARYYSQYADLMNFWRSQAGVKMVESRYEDLVVDTRTQIETVLSACELQYESQIDDFHKSNRIVRTASNDQVRQPVYQSSIENWKNYESQLEPLIQELLELGVMTRIDHE